MSPERVAAFKDREQDYHSRRKRLMGQLAAVVLTARLGLHIRTTALEKHRMAIRRIKITMLCTDFIRIIKNKFRLKIT
jgi:hypothetical protein